MNIICGYALGFHVFAERVLHVYFHSLNICHVTKFWGFDWLGTNELNYTLTRRFSRTSEITLLY